jgi:hypothetical protein
LSKYHINAKGEPGKCRAWLGKCPFGGDSDHHETPEQARDAFEKSMSSANTPDALKKVEQTKPAFEYNEEYVDRDENGDVVSYGFEHRRFDLILTKNTDNTFTIHEDYVGNEMGKTVFAYDGDPKNMESIGSYAVAAFDRKPFLPAPSGGSAKKALKHEEEYVDEDLDENGNVVFHGFEHRRGDFILAKNRDNTFTVHQDYVGNNMGETKFTYEGDPKDKTALESAAIAALNDNWGK